MNNEINKLQAVERIWRDFYTGQRLENWTKPYYSDHDTMYGDTYNCMGAYTDEPWEKSWNEKHGPCNAYQLYSNWMNF